MVSHPKGSFFSVPSNNRNISLLENIKLFHLLRENLPQPEKASLRTLLFTLRTLHTPLTSTEINQGCNPWVRLTLEDPKLLYLIQVKIHVGVCLYTAIA